MSTITKEFTKEQLIARINQVMAINKFRIKRDPEADGLAMDNELFAIALASLEAEPVAFRSKLKPPFALGGERWDYTDHRQPDAFELEHCVIERLFTAPPAPVSVPDDGREQFEAWFKFHHGDEHSIVKLHRANGGTNYRDPHVDLAWIAWKDSRSVMLQSFGNSEQLSSPVIPDGWMMVPVNTTRAMIDAAARVEEDGYDAKHKAMLAAAPKSGVKCE